MTVVLSEGSARFVEEQVSAGRFASAQAAIDAAVDRLRSDAIVSDDDDDDDDDDELSDLRPLIDVGLAEADRGQFVDFTAEDVIAARRAALAARVGRP